MKESIYQMIQSAPFDPLVAGHLIVEMGNLAIQKKKKTERIARWRLPPAILLLDPLVLPCKSVRLITLNYTR